MAGEFEIAEEQETPTAEDVEPTDETTGVPVGEVTEVEGAEPSGEIPTGEPPKESGVQKRIDQITREKHEEREGRQKAETEAAFLRGRLAEREAGGNVPPEEAPKPSATITQDQFETEEEFEQARIDQRVNAGLAQERIRLQRVEQQKAADAKAAQRSELIGIERGQRADEVGAHADDLMLDAAERAADSPDKRDETMLRFVDWCLANPAASKRIGEMKDPVQKVAAVGKAVATMENKPPPKKTTNAPAPPETVPGGGSPPRKTVETMTPEEQRAYWRDQEMKKRGIKQ